MKRIIILILAAIYTCELITPTFICSISKESHSLRPSLAKTSASRVIDELQGQLNGGLDETVIGDAGKTVLDITSDQLRHIARKLKLSQEAVEVLSQPEEICRVTAKIMLDGEKGCYESEFIRVRHSTARGPAKGGIRYTKDVSLDDTKGLAFLMTIKTAGMALPLGGSKGEGQVDIEALNLNEIARITKEGVWQLMEIHKALGEEIDIPAPDQKTGQTIMAYMTEAYLAWSLVRGTLKNKDAQKLLLNIPVVRNALSYYRDGSKRIREKPISDTETVILREATRLVEEGGYVISELATFTGKPLDRSGVCGREEATGRGGYYAEVAALEHYSSESLVFDGKDTVEGITHVIRGYGNVGAEFARICSENGGKFMAVANAISAIKYTGEDNNGINIEELNRFIEGRRRELFEVRLQQSPDLSEKSKQDLWEVIQKTDIDLAGYRQRGVVSLAEGEDIIDIRADLLVESAKHCTIHAANAHRVNQKMLLELANAPTTTKADAILAKKGIIIIPDVLANAGGVTVSMYEAKQNITGVEWPIELTHARLEERIKNAMAKMFNMIKEHPLERLSNRDAYWILSLKRVSDAIEARMWRRQDPRLFAFSAHASSFLRSIKTSPETDDELWKLHAAGEIAMQEAIDSEEDARNSRALRIVDKIASHFQSQDPDEKSIRLCLIGGPTAFKIQAIRHMIDILGRNYGIKGFYFDLDLNNNPAKLSSLIKGEHVEGIRMLGPSGNFSIQAMQLNPGDVIFAEGPFAIANETLDKLPEGLPHIAIAVDICPSMQVTLDDSHSAMLTNDDYTILREMLVSRFMRSGRLSPYESLLNAIKHRRQAVNEIYTTFHNRATVIYNTFDPFELLFVRNYALTALEYAREKAQSILDKKSADYPLNIDAWHAQRLATHLIKILQRLPDIAASEMRLALPPTAGFRQILPGRIFNRRPYPPLPVGLDKLDVAGPRNDLRQRLERLWGTVLTQLSPTKTYMDSYEVIDELRRFDQTTHARFRVMLSRLLAQDLVQHIEGVENVWCIGSVADGNVELVGPASDIDFVVEVKNSKAKAEVVQYLSAVNQYFKVRFNNIINITGANCTVFIDFSGKVMTSEEMQTASGPWQSLVRSPISSSAKLAGRDINQAIDALRSIRSAA